MMSGSAHSNQVAEDDKGEAENTVEIESKMGGNSGTRRIMTSGAELSKYTVEVDRGNAEEVIEPEINLTNETFQVNQLDVAQSPKTDEVTNESCIS